YNYELRIKIGRVRRRSRFSIVNCKFPCRWSLQPVPLQSPIQRAATEAERLRRLADVAVEPAHRLFDQEPFDLLEAHVLDARRLVAIEPQPELADPDDGAGGHQHAALDRVIELPDVAGPRMI